MKTDTTPKTTTASRTIRIATYIFAGVLALMPLHAFLTVWLGTLSGQYEYARLWKEVILLALLPVAAVAVARTPGLWRRLREGWLLWCILAYGMLHLALGGLALARGQVSGYALIYAWVINLRLLLVFVIALALASHWVWLRAHWQKLLLVPAALVVGFGLLQLFALPLNFLEQFGYGKGTVVPYETVDQKLDYVRIQSTLRGSNPLGAYLVIVLAALSALLLRNAKGANDNRHQMIGVIFFSSALIVLMATYSRSAYVGAFIAVLLSVWLVLRSRKARQRLALLLAAGVLLAGSLAFVFRENDRFENTFFHTDEHSTSPMSSNEGRTMALQSGSGDVLTEPFGRGPGTAGPASQHNVYSERIAENYYLQIGQELGWLGIGLFVAINLLVARQLWQRRQDALARLLLASLAGIAFINLLLHAWTDDTLALVWWGLAGIALAGTAKKESEKAEPKRA